jgi:hypothetical protein
MNTYEKNVIKIINNIGPVDRLTASSPSKISLKGNNSFSMLPGPQFGCPGATEACASCYAMKGHHHMPNVQRALAKNWLFVKQLESMNDAKRATKEILNIIPIKSKIFRIHESSDFFSQWYVDVWDEVVKSKEKILFWSYTRSFNLDFTSILANNNFVLWASADKFNLEKAKEFVDRYTKFNVRYAYGPWGHNEPIPKDSFICPTSTKKLKIEGACENCKLCVIKNRTPKHVVFLAH